MNHQIEVRRRLIREARDLMEEFKRVRARARRVRDEMRQLGSARPVKAKGRFLSASTFFGGSPDPKIKILTDFQSGILNLMTLPENPVPAGIVQGG